MTARRSYTADVLRKVKARSGDGSAGTGMEMEKEGGSGCGKRCDGRTIASTNENSGTGADMNRKTNDGE